MGAKFFQLYLAASRSTGDKVSCSSKSDWGLSPMPVSIADVFFDNMGVDSVYRLGVFFAPIIAYAVRAFCLGPFGQYIAVLFELIFWHSLAARGLHPLDG